MDTNAILDIGLDALVLAAKLCAPVLITALVIGFAVSLLQSITQIQEVTLSFVPKAIGVSVALLVAEARGDRGRSEEGHEPGVGEQRGELGVLVAIAIHEARSVHGHALPDAEAR